MSQKLFEMTTTEASRNFSDLMKNIDRYGVVRIARRYSGYVAMTDEEYEGLAGTVITGKCGDGLCRVRIKGDTAEITKVDPDDGVSGAFSIWSVPAGSVEIVIKGTDVSVKCRYADYKRENGVGEVSYRAGELYLHLPDEEIGDGYDMTNPVEKNLYRTALKLRGLLRNKDAIAGNMTIDLDMSVWG